MAEARGLFVDTSLCTGCHACNVACKQWNELGAQPGFEQGTPGLDAAGGMSASDWRHVRFVEQMAGQGPRLLAISDSCKHCVQAPCLEVCPTGAIVRTEFESVFVRQELCNGCRACVGACPFGAMGYSPATGTVHKCTLCYDRLQAELPPACAQACPTGSIASGKLADLRSTAQTRVDKLRRRGEAGARLYGQGAPLGGLNAFYLLLDRPEAYGLPRAPELPSRSLLPSWLVALAGAALVTLGSLLALRRRGQVSSAETGGE